MPDIYWIERLLLFRSIVIVIVFILLSIAIAALIGYCDSSLTDDICKFVKRHFSKWLIATFITSALALFLPNREELNAIYNSNRLNEHIENTDNIKENLKNKKDSVIWIKTICPKCYYQFEFYKMKSKLYDN